MRQQTTMSQTFGVGFNLMQAKLQKTKSMDKKAFTLSTNNFF